MNFFDQHPVLYPWPEILREKGWRFTYKPREVFFKHWLGKLNLTKGDKVLDIGCGDGVLLDRLAAEYQIVGFGVDVNQKSIARAKRKSVSQPNLKVASAEKLPYRENFFDAIISFDTLEHVYKQKLALAEMVRVTKPGGRLLLYTINKKQEWTLNWILAKLGIDVYKLVDHKPALFSNPEKVALEFKKRGVRVIKINFFNSFFTLFADESIMVMISFLTKRGLNKSEFNKFGVFILFILTGFSKLATPVLNLLEIPWQKRGYANSFLILGEKR